jgi:predicted DCC family thiol-disulfide oxidoreductase YuxK
MNTLQNHVLIYDKNCPLCRAYTGAFINTNMLDSNGRMDYCQLDRTQFPGLDMAMAKDKIALVDTTTGTISYGIESLFKILANSFPFLGIIFRWGLFKILMDKFYGLVSYNRKVISPESSFESSSSCTPSLHLAYRWAYIILSWVFTSLVLNQFAQRITPFVPPTNFFREWLICGGQIIFQSISVMFNRRDRLIHYLGNLMTVSNIGALILLVPLLIPVSVLPPEVYLFFFVAVVTFMLWEHNRRTKILGLTIWASVSWVVYRLIVLAIIL